MRGAKTFGYREKPGLLEFFIQDTGIGVGKDVTKKIFETIFHDEVSHSREHEGSDLGLSIAQGLV